VFTWLTLCAQEGGLAFPTQLGAITALITEFTKTRPAFSPTLRPYCSEVSGFFYWKSLPHHLQRKGMVQDSLNVNHPTCSADSCPLHETGASLKSLMPAFSPFKSGHIVQKCLCTTPFAKEGGMVKDSLNVHILTIANVSHPTCLVHETH